jgi:hypothetical protein
VKRRLHQPPLAPPEIALADEQTLTEEAFGDALGQLALVKLGLLENQNLLNVFRMIQEDPVLKGDGHANDVAVLSCDTAQGAEGVLANRER